MEEYTLEELIEAKIAASLRRIRAEFDRETYSHIEMQIILDREIDWLEGR